MALFNVDPAEAEAWAGVEQEPEEFEIYPDNAQSYRVFMGMSTQWRWTGGMVPQRIGLDYNALTMPFEAAGVRKKDRCKVFADLQLMEHAAIDEWRKQWRAQDKRP